LWQNRTNDGSGKSRMSFDGDDQIAAAIGTRYQSRNASE